MPKLATPRTKTPLGRIALVSLGCSKNLADSEGLVGDLLSAGFALADSLDTADLALINTCGFIDPAKEESVQTIARVAARKEYGRLRGLIVSGCLVERYEAALRRDLPEVDRWLPFRDYPRIVEAARELMGLAQVRELPRERVILTPSHYAYMKISEGCDQKCAFCAIPSFRGRLKSRTVEDLVEDARRIAARGVTEVNLVSQDTTAYGRNLYGKPRLADLLRALTEVEGPRWWRVLYLYPSILREDVLEEIAANPRIVKYVDVPLQHVTDGMLRSMRRGINAERQRRLLETIRRKIPGVAIRSTMISGFPGETESDHQELLATVREGWFDRLGVFTFSREDGTPSHDLPDQVPAEVAERRRGEVMEAQAEVHRARNHEKVGRTLDVLVESVDPLRGAVVGRTEHDAPDVDGRVTVRPVRGVKPGAILAVRITGVEDGYDLVGEPATAVSVPQEPTPR